MHAPSITPTRAFLNRQPVQRNAASAEESQQVSWRFLLDQFRSALCAAAAQYIATIVRKHALPETVNAFMPPIVRLESSFHKVYRSVKRYRLL